MGRRAAAASARGRHLLVEGPEVFQRATATGQNSIKAGAAASCKALTISVQASGPVPG